MARKKTYKTLIENNYDRFVLRCDTFNNLVYDCFASTTYDNFGRLSNYFLLHDCDYNYVLCIRKHESPLYIDDTIKKHGESCCNTAWYYYVSDEEAEQIKKYFYSNINDAHYKHVFESIVKDVQKRASKEYADSSDVMYLNDKLIYGVAVYEINATSPNILQAFIKPKQYSNKNNREFIKKMFFTMVG